MEAQRTLQATQKIISLFESSNEQSEEALDSLPGIYAVIHPDGKILKGNRQLASFMGARHELLLGQELSRVFTASNWNTFRSKLLDIGSHSGEFQTDLLDWQGNVRNFLWSLSLLKTNRTEVPILVTVLGRDITEVNRATERNARVQLELNTAKVLQDTLLPNPVMKFGNSSISGYYESATECGGDWWHYGFIQGKLFLWIGDVTGHGVPAALITSGVNSAVSIIEAAATSPAHALNVLNRAVWASAKGKREMTLLSMSVDLNTGRCAYASASHESCILLRKSFDNSKCEMQFLASRSSIPLGSSSATEYEENYFQLTHGDWLFFCTDGIFDVQGQTGKPWRRAQAIKAIQAFAIACESPDAFKAALRAKIDEIRQCASLVDDLTFFVFQYNET